MSTRPDADLRLARVRALEREALANLTAAAGADPLCGVGRTDAAAPAKYQEGAVAALAQARRALARPGTDALAALRALEASWLERGRTRLADAPAWRAYLDGGAAALREALADPPA